MFDLPADSDALVDRLRETERAIAVLQAEQLHLMTALYRQAPDWILANDDTPALVDAAEVAAAEIGVALRISRRSAADRLGLALSLRWRPPTMAALERGELSLVKTRIIAEAVGELSEEDAHVVEARVLPKAAAQTPAGLGTSVARAVLAVDPDAARRRRDAAVADRTVRYRPGTDGMASLWARLPVEDALGCYRELCELAEIAVPVDSHGDPTGQPDQRTADARRADTLIDLIMGASITQRAVIREPVEQTEMTPHAPAPAADGPAAAQPAADDATVGCPRSAAPQSAASRRPVVNVTVPWTTLAGLTDDPGWLTGYGPIDADHARQLSADGVWRRLLTDPASGVVLDVGTTRYTPPAALAALIRARDGTCRWYGCRQPAERCDLDHTNPFPHGPTARINLADLCRGHHRLKTHTTWRVQQDEHGVLTWTSPTGQRVTTEPWSLTA